MTERGHANPGNKIRRALWCKPFPLTYDAVKYVLEKEQDNYGPGVPLLFSLRGAERGRFPPSITKCQPVRLAGTFLFCCVVMST